MDGAKKRGKEWNEMHISIIIIFVGEQAQVKGRAVTELFSLGSHMNGSGVNPQLENHLCSQEQCVNGVLR